MRLHGNDDCTVCVCATCSEAKKAIRYVAGQAVGYKDFLAWYQEHAEHEHNFYPIDSLKRTSGWAWAKDKPRQTDKEQPDGT